MKKIVVLAVAVAFFAAAVAYAAPRSVGTLKMKDPSLAIELTFASKEKLIVTGKGVKIPAGTYTPQSYTVMKRSRDGTVWKLEGSGAVGPLASITVEKDKTTELDLGGTLTVKPIVYRSGVDKLGKLIIPIGYSIQGENGAAYGAAIYMGARKVPAPFFQITDENGKVLAEGKFEYG